MAPPEDFVFILVARGITPLVDVSSAGGNHNLLAHQILSSVQEWQGAPLRRSIPDKSGAYYFHLLVQDGLAFLVCASSKAKTGVCFSLLEEIRARFPWLL